MHVLIKNLMGGRRLGPKALNKNNRPPQGLLYIIYIRGITINIKCNNQEKKED